jgi:hypothetical protein
MSKQLVKKIVAGSLIVVTVTTSTVTDVQACDSAAIMEATNQISMMAGPLAPMVFIGGSMVAGGAAIIGIATAHTNVGYNEIYQTLGHLPDRWKPNSVVEKVKPNGKIVQRRFYDAQGRPQYDIDLTNHGQPEWHPFGYGGKHIHEYNWANKRKPRQTGRELTEEEYNKYVRNFDSKQAERIRVKTNNNNNK